jgi:uncharacterized YccA/Bax inhibitor family protein
MSSRNPIFARLDNQTVNNAPPSNSSAGFAYQEGVEAYQSGNEEQFGWSSPLDPTAPHITVGNQMTLDDVLIKTGTLTIILVIAAAGGWVAMSVNPPVIFVAALAGFILGIVNTFKKKVNPTLIMLYTAAQGVFLGGVSQSSTLWAEQQNAGNLVGQAILGTLVAFVTMLALYKSKLVKVNSTFIKMMMIAIVSYLVIAVTSAMSALFGTNNGLGFYGAGKWGIVLCLAGVALASFSLMMDFESITQGINQGLPKNESWRMAFGLMVTLVWLYLEILRLLRLAAALRG